MALIFVSSSHRQYILLRKVVNNVRLDLDPCMHLPLAVGSDIFFQLTYDFSFLIIGMIRHGYTENDIVTHGVIFQSATTDVRSGDGDVTISDGSQPSTSPGARIHLP